MKDLGLIAGKGDYPFLVASEARKHGVERIHLAAFDGETSEELEKMADRTSWMRVGQLSKLVKFFASANVKEVIMAGQITPKRLFDVKPDIRALIILATLKERNAESIFGAIADELGRGGAVLLPATTFLEEYLAGEGHLAGPRAGKTVMRDIDFGWPIAKKVSELNIGQTVVVKKGTVLAVEGYEGTDAAIRRGGELGRGGATVLKVTKPNQDMRFDVPVVGPRTLRVAAESGIGAVVCEAGKTLLLHPEVVEGLAREHGVTVWGR